MYTPYHILSFVALLHFSLASNPTSEHPVHGPSNEHHDHGERGMQLSNLTINASKIKLFHDHVVVPPPSTKAHTELFYSHRREHKDAQKSHQSTDAHLSSHHVYHSSHRSHPSSHHAHQPHSEQRHHLHSSQDSRHLHQSHKPQDAVIKTSRIKKLSGTISKVVTVVETFKPTTYSEFTNIQTKTTILSRVIIHSKTMTIPLIIYPGGVGYAIPTNIPPGEPLLPLPSGPPKEVKHTSKHRNAPVEHTKKHTVKHTSSRNNMPTHVTSFNAWPSGFSSSVVAAATVTNDGVSTTTGSNSHTTILPIVGGIHCFFCPSIGGTIIGLVLPPLAQGVYDAIEIAPPANLPAIIHVGLIKIPNLTIGPGGTPTYTSQEASKTSKEKSCTKTSTVTDETVYVSYGLNSASKTTATNTFSTAFEERTGCSLRAASTETRTTVAKCKATRTVTDKTIYLSYGIDSQSKTTATSTITTRLETISGCDPTPTTVTTSTVAQCSRPTSDIHGNRIAARADGDADCPITQWVFPVNGEDINAANQIGKVLRQMVGKEASIKVFGNTDSPTGIDYFILDVTEKQARELEQQHSKIIQAVAPPPQPCIINTSGCPQLRQNYGLPFSTHENSRRSSFDDEELLKRTFNSTLIERAIAPLPQEWPPQEHAPEQLMSICKPKDKTAKKFFRIRGKPYYYDKSGGEGVEVYLFDSGVESKNPEFDHVEKWHWVGPKWPKPTDYDDELPTKWKWETSGGSTRPEDPNKKEKHGTAMMSGILGKRYGVAKNALPFVIQDGTNRKGEITGYQLLTNYVSMLDFVIHDRQDRYMTKMGKEKPDAPLAVLSWSSGLYFGTDVDAKQPTGKLYYNDWTVNMLDKLRLKIEKLGTMGVLTIVAAGEKAEGNQIGSKKRPGVQEWPALFKTDFTTRTRKSPIGWQLITVGSVDFHGENKDSITHDSVSVYAPGYDIYNAVTTVRVNGATSFATAMTSGLAAYFAGLQSFKDEVKGRPLKERAEALSKKIIDTAYSRNRLGGKSWPNVIYNGNLQSCDAGESDNARHKRGNACNRPKSQTHARTLTHHNPQSTTHPLATLSCAYFGPNPPVASAYCKCLGSTFRPTTSVEHGTINSCAFTKLPTVTYDPIPGNAYTTISSLCLKGSAYAGNGVDWTSIKGCTVSSTSQKPSGTSKVPDATASHSPPTPTCHLQLQEGLIPHVEQNKLEPEYWVWGTLYGDHGQVLESRPEQDGLVTGLTLEPFGNTDRLMIARNTPQSVDYAPFPISTALVFEYGSVKWTSEDANAKQLPYCTNVGSLDSGHRSMDCYFEC